MKRTKDALEMDVIEKIRELFKKHGILNSSHNVPQRDTPIAEDYSDISIEPGEVKYTAVDDYLEMSYSSIVGSLIYIAITARPDLAFAIGKVSRGMHQPNPRHIAMLKHLLGYLRKTQNFKMVYKRNNNAVEVLFKQIGDRDVTLATLCASDQKNIDPLGGFTDANLANKADEQSRSISGYCFYLFGCMVSWRSKLQTITAASTFESELVALAFAANEAVWIRKLLTELSFGLPTNINFRSDTEPNGAAIKEEIDPASVIDLDRHGEDVPPSAVSQSSLAPTPIACDNQAVVAASGNPETSQRTRHLDMRYFKVRDYIRQQQLRVRHIRTDVNVADFFTKQLPKKDYQRYRDYLGMEDHSV